jgi:hypothetical protein
MNDINSKTTVPETKPVEVILPNATVVNGNFLIWNEDPANKKLARLTLQFQGHELSSSNLSLFRALFEIRQKLEPDGILVRCYGSTKHVWPSGMGASMTRGVKSYKHYLGKRGDLKDIVHIFDSGPEVDPCTCEEQHQFHQKWLSSIGIDPQKEVIPWKNLFMQQPIVALKLFFKKKFQRKGSRA